MTKQELETLKNLLNKLFDEEKSAVIKNAFDGDEDSFDICWEDDPFDVDDGFLLAIDTVIGELN